MKPEIKPMQTQNLELCCTPLTNKHILPYNTSLYVSIRSLNLNTKVTLN